MSDQITFWAIFASSSLYALCRGGEPERLVAAICIMGVIATQMQLAPWAERHKHIEFAPLVVDVLVAAALWPIAMRSRRYWPLWITTFQIFQVVTRFQPFAPGASARVIYGLFLSLWGFAIFPILAIGTLRHQIRLKRGCDERPWTEFPR